MASETSMPDSTQVCLRLTQSDTETCANSIYNSGTRQHVRLPRQSHPTRSQRCWQVSLLPASHDQFKRLTLSLSNLQVLPPSPLPEKRMARSLLPNHRRRIRLQDHQSRHRRTTKEDKITALGYGRHRALQIGIEILLSRCCGRHLSLRCRLVGVL